MFKGIKIAMLGLTAAAVVVGAVPSKAEATGCGSAASVAADIWKQIKDYLKCSPDAKVCLTKVIAKAMDLTTLIYSIWNTLAANSWAKIGPRALDTTWQSGSVIGTTGRLWVVPAVTANPNAVVRLKKTGGKGKLGVAVCKTDIYGNTIKLKEYTFDSGDSNVGKVFTHTVPESNEVIISVNMDGKSVTKKFEYEIQYGY